MPLKRWGGFDEAFFLYVEEVDLCYRLQEVGWRVVFIPKAQVTHLEGRSLDRDPTLRLRLRLWGHVRFYRKHYSLAQSIMFFLLVSAVAAGRLAAIFVLAGLDLLGHAPPHRICELVVYDQGRAPFSAWLRAWFAIMLHRPVDVSCLRRKPLRSESASDGGQ